MRLKFKALTNIQKYLFNEYFDPWYSELYYIGHNIAL